MSGTERIPAPGAAPEATGPGPAAGVLPMLRHLCEWVSVALFAALFLTFVSQVFWRYVLREPLVWTLEAAGLLFVTVSLFTAATQMPLRDHVGLDLAVERMPPGPRRIARTLSLLLFAGVMLASIPDTIAVLDWMYRERTYALRFNLGHLFVLMIGFVAIYAARALWDVWRMWRRG